MSFEAETTTLISALALNSSLLAGAAECGYITATPVQAQVIPCILARQDLLVSAATGSGKTAAFLLPTLERLLSAPDTGTRALILVPTRELALQIATLAKNFAKSSPLKFGLITGGEDFKKQQNFLLKEYDLIIATPGRLLEHLQDNATALQNIEMLILDEADRMLDMGFSDAVLSITEACQFPRQTLLFSATLDNPAVQRFAANLLHNPQTISLQTIQDPHQNIEQQVIACDDFKHKLTVLRWLLHHETYEKALIFTNSKLQADSLVGPLRGQKLRVGVLHGDMDQSERKKVLGFFRNGTINILVSTDIAGRGLDINGIERVINFDMPRNGHQYVHRIGRTGRNNETGIAISLINSTEWNLMAGIERYLKQKFIKRSIKEVEGHFKGPKKLKSSGKAAGSKQKAIPDKKEPVKKPKQRLRDTKNIGKRRSPSNPPKEQDVSKTQDTIDAS